MKLSKLDSLKKILGTNVKPKLISDSMLHDTIEKYYKFGFITTEDEREIFFHYSALVMDGFKTIENGAKVKFDVESTDRGDRAINIEKL
jgi:CspA family cold shock protein